jgi:hypothetical protein
MSGAATFWYGAVGAILGAFIVQLLPVGYSLLKGKSELEFSWSRLVGFLIILVGLVAIGGLVAVGLGRAAPAAVPLQAIAYGLGWQSTAGGLLKTAT